jgi:hypothetical protein
VLYGGSNDVYRNNALVALIHIVKLCEDASNTKAKHVEYDKLILNSHNKIKTMGNIINKESGRKNNSNNMQALDVDGKKNH